MQRTLYCYVQESLVHTLRKLVDVQAAAYALAIQRGYRLGPLFVEEDDSGSAMWALFEAVEAAPGRVAVAVPHRGHLIALGGLDRWQQLLEELTGHPLVVTGRTP